MSIVKRLFGLSGKNQNQPNGEPDRPSGDPFSLDRFGGSWEAAMASVLRDDKELAAYINYVKTGQVQTGSSAANPASNRSPWQLGQPFRDHQLTLYAIAAALPPNQRTNLGTITGCDWSVRRALERFATAKRLDQQVVSRQPLLAELEQLGPRLGWAPDEIVQVLVSGNSYWARRRQFQVYPDYEEFVRREYRTVAAALTPAHHAHAAIWERLEGLSPETLLLLAPQICDAATATSKTIRKIGLEAIASLPTEVAVQELKNLATTAKAPQRAEAVAALATFVGPAGTLELRLWANEALAEDRAQAVKDAVSALDDEPTEAVVRPDLPTVDLQKVTRIPVRPVIPNQDLEPSLLAVANGTGTPDRMHRYYYLLGRAFADQASAMAGLTTSHIARLLLAYPSGLVHSTQAVAGALANVDGPSPLEISAVAKHDERDEADAIQVVSCLYAANAELWDASDLEPWVNYHADALARFIELQEYSRNANGRNRLLQTLGAISPLPSVLQLALAHAAVDGYKAERPLMHRMVRAEHVELILPYLKSRKASERLGAARWLLTHPVAEAGDPLVVAVRIEKQDQVKAAMLSAMEVIGLPLDEFLGAEALLADATKALAKKSAVPAAMSWVNVAALPPLTWDDDGSPVATEIVTRFLANAVKNKTAEPSPILRRHFATMKPSQVRTFGSALLDLWLAEDLRTMNPDEAMAEAVAVAPRHHQWAQSGYRPEFANMTVDQVTEALYQQKLQTIAGSATKSKGLLAVVAASAGGDVADRSLAYIRKHRGHRVSQAKVLLEMLAWIDQPATVQAVMSIGVRFRPKGIQNEALKQAELLADRRGWTLDDLADRSVPTGGFESNGRQEFNYGERTFTAHLGDDLTVSLTNDETGKTVRSLPKGRADEDEELIADAKKDFTAAKKELKNAGKLQPDRLHLAMCVQRRWTVDDFNRYFLDHPVMIRLATRLVWLANENPAGGQDDTSATVAFRPLTDATLVNAQDDDVVLAEGTTISLAHQHLVSPEQATAWHIHLADYEIQPVFSQFGRPVPQLGAEQTLIEEFRGYMHNDGSLRGLMNRYAWELGQPMDAGIVGELVKRVPTADLTAVLALDGGIPAGAYDIGSWPLALSDFYFVRSSVGYPHRPDAVPLNEVPPILLTEFYGEVQAIANGGSGFDPDSDTKINK